MLILLDKSLYMNLRTPLHWATKVIKGRSNRFVSASAMGTNLAFGSAMCIAFLGLEPFLTDVGCWQYLAFTTILLGAIVSTFLDHYHCLPGSGVRTTLGFVGGGMFLVYASGTLLPAVPPITEPLGVGMNLVYYALATVVVLSTTVFLHTVATSEQQLEQEIRALQ